MNKAAPLPGSGAAFCLQRVKINAPEVLVTAAATTTSSRCELIEALAEPRKANSGHVLLVRNGSPCRGWLFQYFAWQGVAFFRNMAERRYNFLENILTRFIKIDKMDI